MSRERIESRVPILARPREKISCQFEGLVIYSGLSIVILNHDCVCKHESGTIYYLRTMRTAMSLLKPLPRVRAGLLLLNKV